MQFRRSKQWSSKVRIIYSKTRNTQRRRVYIDNYTLNQNRGGNQRHYTTHFRTPIYLIPNPRKKLFNLKNILRTYKTLNSLFIWKKRINYFYVLEDIYFSRGIIQLCAVVYIRREPLRGKSRYLPSVVDYYTFSL